MYVLNILKKMRWENRNCASFLSDKTEIGKKDKIRKCKRGVRGAEPPDVEIFFKKSYWRVNWEITFSYNFSDLTKIQGVKWKTAEIQGGFKAFKVGDQNSRCFPGFQGFQGSVDTLIHVLKRTRFIWAKYNAVSIKQSEKLWKEHFNHLIPREKERSDLRKMVPDFYKWSVGRSWKCQKFPMTRNFIGWPRILKIRKRET